MRVIWNVWKTVRDRDASTALRRRMNSSQIALVMFIVHVSYIAKNILEFLCHFKRAVHVLFLTVMS